MLKKSDLAWILAFPLYQTLGTLRHEGSHALAALLQGTQIEEFVFWPTVTSGVFRWGYVRLSGSVDWLFYAAPYLGDLLTYSIFAAVCLWIVFRRRWVWLNLVIIGMISPLVNSLYNYWGSQGSTNDVGTLFNMLPPSAVHAYFLITISFYALGIFLVFRVSKMKRR